LILTRKQTKQSVQKSFSFNYKSIKLAENICGCFLIIKEVNSREIPKLGAQTIAIFCGDILFTFSFEITLNNNPNKESAAALLEGGKAFVIATNCSTA
jgi:hypothetical protein